MSLSAPKKSHKQKWDDVQRSIASREWADSNPYMRARTSTHPYDPNNVNNPYARKPKSAKRSSPQREQSCKDNDSTVGSEKYIPLPNRLPLRLT